MDTELKWDFFICHASEDKDDIARPLAETLQTLGFRIWYDEFTLRLSESLNRAINRGLTSSKYGIVILSPSFLPKQWTNHELDGLLALETTFDEPKIIYIVHQLDHKALRKSLPSVAGIKYMNSSDGVEKIVDAIVRDFGHNLDLPENLGFLPHDILTPGDIVPHFRQIREFESLRFDTEKIYDLFHALILNGIRTRSKLKQLVSSDKTLNTLRTLYIDELKRPLAAPIDPYAVANWGVMLFLNELSPESLRIVKTGIRFSEEYRQVHQPNRTES